MKRTFFIFNHEAHAVSNGVADFGPAINNTEEKAPKLTFGQEAVGITFNPGGMPEVNRIKELSAALIDELHNQKYAPSAAEANSEKLAQFTLAIRKIQEGQMWGVKAATWQY